MKTFTLIRGEDVTGISGTGRVAVGWVAPSGAAVIEWQGENRSIVIWPEGLDVAMRVHGHDGRTRVVWDDEK